MDILTMNIYYIWISDILISYIEVYITLILSAFKLIYHNLGICWALAACADTKAPQAVSDLGKPISTQVLRKSEWNQKPFPSKTG